MSLLEAPTRFPAPAGEAPCPAATEGAVAPDRFRRPARPGVVVELAALADPVRAARRISAAVNNTRLALTELTVAGGAAYPVVGSITGDGPVLARFSVRDAATVVDHLVLEELLALVATVVPVVSARAER